MKKYKIIKTYPGSDKLGTVITLDKNGECWSTPQLVIESDCKNNPEFFEEIIEKKEYQILKIKTNSTRICDCVEYGNEYVTALLNSEHTSIYSIKRLSDSEVFSIGDKCTNGIITGFKLDSNGVPYNGGIGVCFHTEERIITEGLKRCEKAKPVLLVTEDGVELFKNDKVNSVNKTTFILNCGESDSGTVGSDFIPNDKYVYFSTLEKAQEWIILNKPVLSLKDVASIYPGINKEHNSPSHQAEQLKALVKSRL